MSDIGRRSICSSDTAVEDSGYSVVPVYEFEAPVPWDCHHWKRYTPIDGDILCKCPKPLVSVFEICGHCVGSSRAVINDAIDKHLAGKCERLGCEFNIPQFPLG